MISQDELIKELGVYYSYIEPVSESVLLCHRTRNGHIYQIVFFDHSDRFLTYDLEAYLKDHIATVYFKNEGALQWNFYLIILSGEPVKEADQQRIEENSDFARKFIVLENQLTLWLNRQYLIKKSPASGAKTGLADIWKGLLTEAKLDCIYSDQIKVNDGIERIISGDYFVEKSAPKSRKQYAEDELHLGELRTLELIKYRPYPKSDKPFNFKKVNLIDGANGHGKTSLLESIEYFITGNHGRVPGKYTYELDARFANDKVVRRFKTDMALFRQRDREWYNGMDRQRESDLAAHFNQFNFYNTDAAFRLTVNKNEKEVEEAFREIALGEEVNFLKRQIAAYESKLQTELKPKLKAITEYKDDITEQRQLLAQLKKPTGNEDTLITALYDKLKVFRLKTDPLKEDIISLDRLKFSLSVFLSELDNTFTNIDWIESYTLHRMLMEEKSLTALTLIFQRFRVEQLILQKNETDQKNLIKQKEKTLELLACIRKYFDEKLFDVIQGFQETIKNQRTLVAQHRRISELYKPLWQVTFSSSSKTIVEIVTEVSKKIAENQEAITKIQYQVNNSRNLLSKLNAVISSLRVQGKEYIDLTADNTDCPLCHTHFNTFDDLKYAILSELEPAAANSDFSVLLEMESKLEKERIANISQRDLLQQIAEIVQLMRLPEESVGFTITAIRRLVEDFLGNTLQEEFRLEELERLESRFQYTNLNEKELIELKNEFSLLYPEQSISLDLINKLDSEIQQELSVHQTKIRTTQVELENLTLTAVDSLSTYDPTFDIHSEPLVNKRLSLVSHYIKELKNLVAKNFDVQKDLSQLQLELISFVQQLDEIRTDMELKQKESGLAKKANDIIAEKEDLKKNLLAQQKRIEDCLGTLQLVVKKHSEDEYIRDFLNTNKQEIKEIFLAVHSPKEFKDISIRSGKIILERNNGDKTDLMRISTGQRSAIALSLFLTLNNKLRNGPPMIIFDDPVAFTDDLNILSFLDHLREVVFNSEENKQLFFATANENLAYLFQKKFEVLGEEFNHIYLER